MSLAAPNSAFACDIMHLDAAALAWIVRVKDGVRDQLLRNVIEATALLSSAQNDQRLEALSFDIAKRMHLICQ
jgi:hypothetical protein